MIDNLRNENAILNAKVDSHVCNASIPNSRDNNDDLLARIDELNISLASLRDENEKLLAKAKELDVCQVTISDLRDKNDILHTKIVELNSCKPSTSTIDHITVCTRCRDIDVDAIYDHMLLIKQQNDHIAKLDAKIAEHNLENEKFKFARSILYNGRHSALRMALATKGETMSKLVPLLKSCPISLRARLPCLRTTRVTFYTLPVILRAKLGKFILGSLTLDLIMLSCIRVRHLALGNQPVLSCLKRKFLVHQMNIAFHLRLLMHPMS
jgi:hypothetical protein